MSEPVPILMQIHDQFDVYERYPHTDHSTISNIAIMDRPNGYRVTTYPSGLGYGFDGFAIDMRTPSGMLGEGAVIRAETSRDFGGLMVLNVNETIEDEEGQATVQGTVGPFPAREGLHLPRDVGFDMFEALHAQVQSLREPLQDTINATGHNLTAASFNFKESTGSASYNHDEKVITHHRSTTYEILSTSKLLRLVLDATVQTPFGAEPSEVVLYRAGTVEQAGEMHDLSFHALMAFSGLHASIRKLYA